MVTARLGCDDESESDVTDKQRKTSKRMYRVAMTTPKGPQTATFPAKSIAHAIELAAGAWCAGDDPKFVAVSVISDRAKVVARRLPEVDLVALYEAGVWAAYERGIAGQA